ncbi:Maf/Ham1 [Didymella exigua CBS 183.55]|uniref:XTP/dITP diphosphatase n=1 Tax=Didymella exigua CBS 183.55 TaxID=1150837 RepID=A0A6A5S0T6_9PLEO|nr:Maf/Ham1 [Didymella exigua CBS 183.55]KAF1933483.1 Maf/Ham1 [Didymella exigua CBS 183.55]
MTSTPLPEHLNFITGNKNKLAEVQAILEGVIELRNQNVDLVEIQGTVEEVTLDKARRAAEAIGGPVLVEDTCLCFKAMNDLPGPYIKWFMLSLGPLELHKMLAGFDDKSAQAVCTFGYCAGPGHEPITFQGRTDGKLVPSRGPTYAVLVSSFSLFITSLFLARMVLFPILNPLLNPFQIPLDIIRTIAPQLDDNLLFIRLPRLVKQDLHDLTVHVLVKLLLLVSSRSKAVVKDGRVATQDNDEIDPAFGEQVAGVPVEDAAALLGDVVFFEVV